MAAQRARKKLRVGDRVRDKITTRTGTVSAVKDTDRPPQYVVDYDAAPQDGFLNTHATEGAERERGLLDAPVEADRQQHS